MNGIVHNCTHANGRISEKMTEDVMFQKIFEYVDRLFNMVNPKKLIYLAIDGVAPRAKINQQRQRRFRSAQAAKEARIEAASTGEVINEDAFDSNCITPGTPFMDKLSAHLQYFIRGKIRDDPKWQSIKVIFSGSQSEGEGEHKIMRFMRAQRSQPGYDANMRHVFYGLDADLIMLSLLSHEHHISLLREEIVFANGPQKQRIKTLVKPDEFQFLHLALLREYLTLDFQDIFKSTYRPAKGLVPFEFDVDRIVDDFVFFCFLIGNDFLPGLPTLDIADGGLNFIFETYKKSLLSMGGYITHWGSVDLPKLQALLKAIAGEEKKAFDQMAKMVEKFGDLSTGEPAWMSTNVVDHTAAEFDLSLLGDDDEEAVDWEMRSGSLNVKNYYYRKFPEFYGNTLNTIPNSHAHCETVDQHIHQLCVDYFEGLLWCYKYYYSGVQSWTWYYQYRYTPLASSLLQVDTSTLSFDFVLGVPFTPLQQLMSVLPAASDRLVPPALRSLMHQGSPIEDFYPPEFDIDMNGKRNPWEGIALIPFIDEHRLLETVDKAALNLTEEEKLRNVNAEVDLLFTYDSLVTDEYSLNNGYTTVNTLVSNLHSATPQPLISSHPSYIDGAMDISLGIPPLSNAFEPNTKLFPPIRHASSRVFAYITPLIPTTHHAVTDVINDPSLAQQYHLPSNVAQVLAALDNHDAHQLKMHYGHADPEASAHARRAHEGRYLPIRLPTASIPLAGYPSLFYLPEFRSFERNAKVNLFGFESRRPSICISPSSNLSRSPIQQVLDQFPPGSTVWAEYPYVREGIVCRVQDDTHHYLLDAEGMVVRRDNSRHELLQFTNAQSSINMQMSVRQAIVGVHVNVVVFVRPFTGMASRPDGSTYKSFAPLDFSPYNHPKNTVNNPNNYDNTSTDMMNAVVKVAAYAPDLIFSQCPAPFDERFTPQPPASITDRFPVGQEVVYCGANDYGTVCRVKTVKDNGLLDLDFVSCPLPIITQTNDLFNNPKLQLKYFPIDDVSAKLKIGVHVLRILTGHFMCDQTPIGLNIRMALLDLSVPEYCRVGKVWSSSSGKHSFPIELSELAVSVFMDYKSHFPELFDFLETAIGSKTRVTARRFTASPLEAEAYMAQVDKYLKNLGINHLIAFPSSAKTSSSKVIGRMEKFIRQIVAATDKQVVPDRTLTDVHPLLVYLPNPNPAWSPTAPLLPGMTEDSATVVKGKLLSIDEANKKFVRNLGDRVLSLRSDDGIPFGAQGTVVGVHGNFSEVLWDREYLTCNNLLGKCEDNRGRIMSVYSILNLSQHNVLNVHDIVANMKITAEHIKLNPLSSHKPVAKPQNHNNNKNNNNNRNNNRNKSQPQSQHEQSQQPTIDLLMGNLAISPDTNTKANTKPVNLMSKLLPSATAPTPAPAPAPTPVPVPTPAPAPVSTPVDKDIDDLLADI